MELVDNDIIENIFLWDSTSSIKEKYNDFSMDIKSLAVDLPDDKTAQEIDNSISTIIAQVIKLKKVLKTPENIKHYITCTLIETE